MSDKFHTALYKAKGSGASGEGVHHWLMQKITAVCMAPAILWLMWQVKLNSSIKQILSSPYNLVASIVVAISVFYHSKLGIQVIIEDYVSNLKFRFFLLILLNIFVFVTLVSLITAIMYYS